MPIDLPMTPQQWFSSRNQIQQVSDPLSSGDYNDLLNSLPEAEQPIGKIATPKTKEEFDALPDGTWYIEPEDGHVYQKGNKTPPRPTPTPRGVIT